MSEKSDRQARDDLLQVVLDSLTYPFYVIDVADYRVRLTNAAAREVGGSDAATCHALAHRQNIPCHTEDHPCPLEIIKKTGKPTVVEHRHYDDQGNPRHIEVHGFPIFDEAGTLTQILEYSVDITDRKKAAEDLHRIEWMLAEKPQTEGELLMPQKTPAYGDLSELNTERLIRDSVGEPILRGIVGDFLSLLETASIIYEKNGDYACGVFSSDWCRFLDLASREQCGTPDNREAMACGQWLCQESCWTKASKRSIELGEPVDIECSGGIRMYAVPIRAGEEIIGSINFGYGDPPRDPQRLKEVADRYGVDAEDLRRHAEQYQSRPRFIIELAKQRLMRSAQLIGEIVQRKQAQAGLLRFKLLSDHSRDIILFMRLDDGRILDANAAAVQAYGYSHEEFLARTIHDLRAKHTQELTLDQMDQADAQGVLFETVHQRKDGRTFPVEVSSQGATIGDTRTLISVIRDISERKKAEQALRESEERFRTLSEAAFEGIGITEQGRIVDVNQTLVDMTGYTRSELIGASSLDFLFPEQREIAEQHVVHNSKEPYEIVVKRKDGTTFIAEARGRASTYMGRPARIGAITDITERKRAEEALRESEQRLRTVLDTLPVGVFIADADGRLTSTNAAARAIWGGKTPPARRIEEYDRYKGWWPDTGRQVEPHEWGMARAILKGETSGPEEIEIQCFDGAHKTIFNYARPIRSDGRITGAVTINVDISDRKQAEEALRESEQQFRRAVENASGGVVIVETGGAIRYANRAFLSMVGYDEQDVQSGTFRWDTITPAEYAPVDAEMVRELLDSGVTRPHEKEYVTRDGRRVPVLISGSVMSYGPEGQPQVVAFVTDLTPLKQAEQALAESQRFLRRITRATPDVIYVYNVVERRNTYINRDLTEILGYSPEAINAMGEGFLARLMHPDDYPRVVERLKAMESAPNGNVLETDYRMRHADGRYLWFRSRDIAFTRAPDGSVQEILRIAQDITERKHAEEELRHSEQRFKSTFENAAVGIAHVALDGRFIRFNNRFVEIVGHPADELTSTTCPQITRRDDWEMERTQVQRLHDGQIHHYTIEKRYVRKDGGFSWVSLTRSLQRDDAGRPEHYIVFVQDISQRKRLEDELRRLNQSLEEEVKVRTEQLTTTVDRLQDEVAKRVTAEGRLRRRSQMLEGFFQHTITPLAFLDRNFNFVRVNEAFARAEGTDPDYFVGKNHFDLYPSPENRAIFEQVVRSRQPYQAHARPFHHSHDRPRRTTYWNWLITPLLDEHGQVEFLVFNLEDVTKQQQALQEVQDRAHQLQQLTLELSQAEDRERKRLAEILHDDLQQMLAAAKFQTGLLGKRVKDDEDVYEITRQIKDLLSQAIDKSRSLSHELSPPVLGQSDLCETFTWLAEHIRAKHGLAVEVEACNPVVVHSEPLKAFLFKAAQEMLFNVIKHAKVKEARLRLRHRRGYISLSVADKGQGFDPKSLGKGGFGLLSIRERVKLLGGRMRIVSVPGKGSAFLIKVPAPQAPVSIETQWAGEPSAAKVAAQRKRRERAVETNLRILLVDDHKIVREGLEAMLLEEQDIQVVGQAGNGREAVELALQLQPDVIVMDVSMPVMAGDEAARQIKLRLPQTRIIALSMFDDPRTADRMRRAGAAAYLLKTAPSEELLATIRGSESASLVDSSP